MKKKIIEKLIDVAEQIEGYCDITFEVSMLHILYRKKLTINKGNKYDNIPIKLPVVKND